MSVIVPVEIHMTCPECDFRTKELRYFPDDNWQDLCRTETVTCPACGDVLMHTTDYERVSPEFQVDGRHVYLKIGSTLMEVLEMNSSKDTLRYDLHNLARNNFFGTLKVKEGSRTIEEWKFGREGSVV